MLKVEKQIYWESYVAWREEVKLRCGFVLKPCCHVPAGGSSGLCNAEWRLPCCLRLGWFAQCWGLFPQGQCEFCYFEKYMQLLLLLLYTDES